MSTTRFLILEGTWLVGSGSLTLLLVWLERRREARLWEKRHGGGQ